MESRYVTLTHVWRQSESKHRASVRWWWWWHREYQDTLEWYLAVLLTCDMRHSWPRAQLCVMTRGVAAWLVAADSSCWMPWLSGSCWAPAGRSQDSSRHSSWSVPGSLAWPHPRGQLEIWATRGHEETQTVTRETQGRAKGRKNHLCRLSSTKSLMTSPTVGESWPAALTGEEATLTLKLDQREIKSCRAELGTIWHAQLNPFPSPRGWGCSLPFSSLFSPLPQLGLAVEAAMWAFSTAGCVGPSIYFIQAIVQPSQPLILWHWWPTVHWHNERTARPGKGWLQHVGKDAWVEAICPWSIMGEEKRRAGGWWQRIRENQRPGGRRIESQS